MLRRDELESLPTGDMFGREQHACQRCQLLALEVIITHSCCQRKKEKLDIRRTTLTHLKGSSQIHNSSTMGAPMSEDIYKCASKSLLVRETGDPMLIEEKEPTVLTRNSSRVVFFSRQPEKDHEMQMLRFFTSSLYTKRVGC